MTGKEKKLLVAKSHGLRPVATITADALNDTTVAHVRGCFQRHPLLKVRVQCDAGEECDAVGAQLAERVPCELVRRIGRVLVLYRPAAEATSE